MSSSGTVVFEIMSSSGTVVFEAIFLFTSNHTANTSVVHT